MKKKHFLISDLQKRRLRWAKKAYLSRIMISNVMTNPLVLILSICGLIFLLAGFIQQRFQPKKINHLYGYRTSNSMKSQESWDFAQDYSAKKMMKTGAYITVLGLLAYSIDFQHLWSVLTALVIVTISPLLMLLQVETELKKRFPKK
jgi:uncharacterized membrane protein